MKYEKSYLDIFKEHYPNFVFKEFYGNYCPAGFFKYGMDMHNPDCSADCDKCWSCTADSEWCESGDYEIPEYWREISAPAQTEAAAPTDKYAEAVQLNAQIMTSAKAAQQNLYDMAMGFKKMRDDKLYKELGYDNFGDYCEGETGMKRRSVYGYISVVENLPSDFVHSSAQIGVKKLSLLATLNEEHRTEIIENTDLESTTVKELREQIEQLKQSEAKTKSQLEHVNTVYEDMYNSCMRNKRLYDEQLDKNTALERQLKELESRPRDVAVDTEELNRRVTEVSVKLQNQAAEQIAEERRDFADKLNRMEEERDRLESRIAELESSENSTEQKDKEIAELKGQIEHLSNKKIKVFAVKLTVEEFERLMDIAKKSGDTIISNAVSTAQIIRI